MMVESIDPFPGRVFDRIDMRPRPASVNQFILVQMDNRLSPEISVWSQAAFIAISGPSYHTPSGQRVRG